MYVCTYIHIQLNIILLIFFEFVYGHSLTPFSLIALDKLVISECHFFLL